MLCLDILLIAARVTQDSGQSPLPSWSCLRHLFGRMPATEDHDKLAEFAALEPINSHTHIALTTLEFVAMLQRLHVHVLDVLVVNDRQPLGRPGRARARPFFQRLHRF